MRTKGMQFATRLLRHMRHDSLFRNSVFIMASMGVAAGFGFIFWIVCARFYSSEQVGIVTAIISVSTLIMTLSQLGFNQAFIRYIPGAKNKQEIINTGFLAVVVATAVVTVAYLLLLPVISPALAIVRSSPGYLIIFLVLALATTLNSLTDSVFIAFRAAHYNLIGYTTLGLVKVMLPVVLVSLGLFGLLLSQAIAMAGATLLSLFFMWRHLKHRFRVSYDHPTARKMARFSVFNHAATLAGAVPGMLLPLVIIHRLGASQEAFFYMAMMVGNLMYVIPSAISSSLFAESSHEPAAIQQLFYKAGRLVSITLIPASLLVIGLGKPILSTFGAEYASSAYSTLVWMVAAALPIAVNAILGTAFKMEHRLWEFLAISTVGSVIILAASYIFAPRGIAAVGICWFVGQSVVAIGFALRYARLLFAPVLHESTSEAS